MKRQGILFLLIFGSHCLAQTGIGIKATDDSAVLEVRSTHKGIKFPVVVLSSTTDGATIDSPALGLIVYNKNSAGTGAEAVSKGFYQYNGNSWEKLLSKKETLDEILKIPFLTPVFVASNIISGTPASVNNGATTQLTFNTLDYNLNNGATGTSPNYDGYTIAEDGVYVVDFSADIRNTSGNNHGEQLFMVYLNGSRIVVRGIQRKFQFGGISNLCTLKLSVGDRLDFRVYSNGANYRIYNTYVSIFQTL